MFKFKNYDVAVIGAGHAGIEAALASARSGAKTAVFTLSLDTIGNMPCNPSIGGTAKGHLVFELDALGGEMGKAADATALQSRMLNLAKGPAVHSLRVQSDRRAYHAYMKSALEEQLLLDIIQDEVTGITVKDGAVCAVSTSLGGYYEVKCAVVATGTYLHGKIYVGDAVRLSGPDGICPATELTKCLVDAGLPIRRFKTGTPARVHRRSIDFSVLERQEGDDEIVPFCFMNETKIVNKLPCYIAYTNEKTHELIRANLHRSPLYGGKIEGVGPRYCPSIEDKVVRFPDKTRHQIFVEPCGESTEEMYLQGMSSSLPFDVQTELYKTIVGFENIELMRPAYAIEYDCCDPTCLKHTLETKAVRGLFGAGQFNGSSGYEEAAVQGFVAGVNASHMALGRESFTLSRQSSYIGTLIDDLVTKGANDPYRMMTSRSEYRLLLRQDNADERLCETGHRLGLVCGKKYETFLENDALLHLELARMEKTHIPACAELDCLLAEKCGAPTGGGATIASLLRRPGIAYADIAAFDTRCEPLPNFIAKKAEIELKYAGYMKRQRSVAEKQKRLEDMALPLNLDYSKIDNMRLEARDKLTKIRPVSFGQAGRISGVSPSDLAVLSVYVAKLKGGNFEK